ncbi:maltoporin [Oceanobacter mangrovi]|uniref:maltoporin n=1 Tax=Oceanobacter mangrovi TaxID=2862510 RepID=UPI001C8D5C57|nr:carbohydrate porin [Oceanobacter mangrovi]
MMKREHKQAARISAIVQKNLAPKALALAVTAAAAFPAVADENPFHLYFRSGIGSAVDGGDQVCYKAQNAPAKYRLGNECETYAAVRLIKGLDVEGAGKFKVTTEMIYETDQNTDWEQINGDTSSADRLAIRRFNVAGTDVIEALPGATLWIGKEFVDRQNVHINDFFYWDPKGPGVGLRDIDVGFGKVGVSWLRNGSTNATDDGGDAGNYVNNTYDIRLSKVALTDKVSAEFGLTLGSTSGTKRLSYDGNDNSGSLVTVNFMFSDVLGGSNKLTLQHAKDGMIADANTGNQNGSLEGDFFRIIDSGIVAIGDQTEAQFVAIYEDKNDDKAATEGYTWTSFGIRPVVQWGGYSSTAFELGYDLVDPKADGLKTASMTKFTVAQQFSAGSKFYSRPSLRLFATFAKWDDAGANSNAGGVTPEHATQGISFGAQTEVWF